MDPTQRPDGSLDQRPRETGGGATSVHPPATELVQYICVSGPHQLAGRSEPGGSGHLTLEQGAWAYCAAGRPTEPHTWREIRPRALSSISHDPPLYGIGADDAP